MAPKFSREEMRGVASPARVRMDGEIPGRAALSPRQIVRQDIMAGGRHLNAVPENNAMEVDRDSVSDRQSPDAFLTDLHKQLSSICSAKVINCQLNRDEDEAPEDTPIFWISKWVDYSDKYGIGYQLCDNSVGVLFNDNTKLILDEAGNELTYIEKNDKEHYYNMEHHSQELKKKVTLLKYFRSYMNEHLIKAGADIVKKEGDDLARLPVLRYWFRTRSAIILHLSNGTLQINYFDDHTKMIVCPLMNAVTYMDEAKQFHVYKLAHLQSSGCPERLLNRLKYGKLMVERMLTTAKTNRAASAAMPFRV